jgi:hypothetical protein
MIASVCADAVRHKDDRQTCVDVPLTRRRTRAGSAAEPISVLARVLADPCTQARNTESERARIDGEHSIRWHPSPADRGRCPVTGALLPASDPTPTGPLAPVNDRHLARGINTEEIISTVHARRAPMMHASAGLAL